MPRAIARNVDLGFVLDDAPVAGNPLMMAELLNNLIDNALRYTPAGGAVTVRPGVDGDCAYFSVDDNGPGIPEHARARVLERFYRVEGTPGDGAGLGLAIVKEVVDRHAGELSVQSAGATGTRVVARFRALRAEPAPQASA